MLHIPIVHAHDVSKQIPWEKNFPLGWKCYKTIGSYISCAFIKIWSTWEVWRALKKLELLSAMPRATLLHFRASRALHILMNARWRMNQLLNNPPLGTMQESAADHVDFSLDFAFHYCNHQFTFCLKPFIHQCVYSPYSYFYIALGAEKENLFNNQRFLGWQETVWIGFKDLKMALQPSIKKRV